MQFLRHVPLPWLNSFKRFPPGIPREPVNPDLLHKRRDHLNVNQTGLLIKVFYQSRTRDATPSLTVNKVWVPVVLHLKMGDVGGGSGAAPTHQNIQLGGNWQDQRGISSLVHLNMSTELPVRRWGHQHHSKHDLTFLDHTWPCSISSFKWGATLNLAAQDVNKPVNV